MSLWWIVSGASTEARGDDLAEQLRRSGIVPNREGVVRYLKRLLPQASDESEIDEWLRDLGSDDFDVRRRATRALMNHPAPPVERLREAATSRDVEVSLRARRILKHVESAGYATTTIRVLEWVQRREYGGLCSLLLELAAQWSDERLLTAAASAVRSTAGLDDAQRLREALRSDHEGQRWLAVAGLAGQLDERDLNSRDIDELVSMMSDSSPRVSLVAAEALADRGDRRCLSGLARLLTTSDERVARRGRLALQALTRHRFLGENGGAALARQWASWLEERPTSDLTFPLSESVPAMQVAQAGGRVGILGDGHVQLRRAASRFPAGRIQVVSVDLSEASAGESVISELATLSSLIHLSLRAAKISDDDLAALTGQRKLATLDLSDCVQVTSDGLVHLGQLGALESLDLASTSVTNLTPLNELRGLRRLSLRQCRKLSPQCLDQIVELPRLEELDLEETTIDEAGLIGLRRFESLRALRLGRKTTDHVLASLGELPLEQLSVAYGQITEEGLRRIANLRELRQLHLYRCSRFDGRSLRHLRGLERLQDVRLVCAQLTDESIGPLTELPALEKLDLYSTQVTGEALKDFRGRERLVSLSLARTPLTNDALVAIGSLRGLVELNLRITPLDDRRLEHLTQLKRLRRLNLETTRIKGPGLAALAELPELEELSLRNTRLDPISLSALSGLRQLRRLDLSNTPITDETLRWVAHLPMLEELGIASTAVSDQGLAHLARMETLQRLEVRRCKITDEGLTALRTRLPGLTWSR